MKRCLLHRKRIQEFKEWLDVNEIPNRDGKGDWQIIQVKTQCGWQVVYDNASSPEHLTVNRKLIPLVKKFIEDTKNGSENQDN